MCWYGDQIGRGDGQMSKPLPSSFPAQQRGFSKPRIAPFGGSYQLVPAQHDEVCVGCQITLALGKAGQLRTAGKLPNPAVHVEGLDPGGGATLASRCPPCWGGHHVECQTRSIASLEMEETGGGGGVEGHVRKEEEEAKEMRHRRRRRTRRRRQWSRRE